MPASSLQGAQRQPPQARPFRPVPGSAQCPAPRRCTWCTARSGRRCACSWLTAVVTRRAPLAPSGWPSAIAPPLGLTRASSSARPSSRSTARPCAAKASLSSITSICASVRPVSASTLRVAGAGPMPMMRGATPAVAMPTTRARGVRPWRGGGGFVGQQQRAGAVVHAGGVAGGHGAVGPHHALELGQRFEAWSRAGARPVSTTTASPFFCGNAHRR